MTSIASTRDIIASTKRNSQRLSLMANSLFKMPTFKHAKNKTLTKKKTKVKTLQKDAMLGKRSFYNEEMENKVDYVTDEKTVFIYVKNDIFRKKLAMLNRRFKDLVMQAWLALPLLEFWRVRSLLDELLRYIHPITLS